MMEEAKNSKLHQSYEALWAKTDPYHPLWKHLLDVASVSLSLPNPLVREQWGWTAEQVALIVGLHDVGKADGFFQYQGRLEEDDLKKLKGEHEQWLNIGNNVKLRRDKWPSDVNLRYRKVTAGLASPKADDGGFYKTDDVRCRHERLSSRFICKALELAGCSVRDRDTICRTVIAHHGYWDEGARGVGPKYKEAQDHLLEMLKIVLGIDKLNFVVKEDHSAFGMRLAGHIVLCDWIASNEKFFLDARLQGIDDPSEYFVQAKLVADEWIIKLGFGRDISEGQPYKVVDKTRPIQQALLDNDILPSLVIIEAPMGEGKTEAAWILAEKWRCNGYHGMFMALPTMATSDSLHKRYQDDYLTKLGCGENTNLVHGMAWLRDDVEPERTPETGESGDERDLAAAWFRPTRRAMLASHGVGTVDQAMLAGMHVKFGFLRLYGLTDRVLVIDEVHAYDAYMSAIICRLLQWCACLKIPVILLSATLSAKQRAAMIEAYGSTGGDPGPEATYPLITVAETGQKARGITANASASRTLKIETHAGLLGDATKTAALAKELVANGGCCCVILNTVKQAQAVYTALGSDVPKLLFHARFTAEDRERITKDVIAKFGKESTCRPEKFILVSTQVVEQSLDVDFDHMITEIAPLDLLLQRSGRIKRHCRDRVGKLKNEGKDERGEPMLHVLLPATEKKGKVVEKPDFGPSQKIYERYPLLSTLTQLERIAKENGNAVNLPNDFRTLIEATYGEVPTENAQDDLKESKTEWDDLQEDLSAQAGEFLLCEPMEDEFDPVGTDEVGDESESGNGWRARTRLGLEDVLVIPLSPKQLEKFKNGDLHPRLVKWLYKRSVKIPPYFWPPMALKYKPFPTMGQGKLKGVWLLPITKTSGGWEWKGLKPDGNDYTINYDSTTGLTHGGDK